MFCHVLLSSLLVSHLAKMNIALQNENGVSCLTEQQIRQLTMPYGGRNSKRHSLQAGYFKEL
jgi:hypothetical protein